MKSPNAAAVFIGMGANLPHPTFGSPQRTLQAALDELERRGVQVLRVSPWYRTAPVPASDQPWFVNAVAELATELPADALLAVLHDVEQRFGRVRTVPNAARLIDLDLLDYLGEIASGGPGRATLPHPRMTGRAFVLRPLADLAPDWRHPVTGATLEARVASIGTAILRNVLVAETVGLCSAVIAEARRFPDLAASVHRMARERTSEAVAQLLEELPEADQLPGFAADRRAGTARYFIELILLPMLMRALFGEDLTALRAEIGPHVARSVAFFLAACTQGAV